MPGADDIGMIGEMTATPSFDSAGRGSAFPFVATVAVSIIATASLLAFFAYVLEVLVDVYEQLWHIRFDVADDDDEEPN